MSKLRNIVGGLVLSIPLLFSGCTDANNTSLIVKEKLPDKSLVEILRDEELNLSTSFLSSNENLDVSFELDGMEESFDSSSDSYNNQFETQVSKKGLSFDKIGEHKASFIATSNGKLVSSDWDISVRNSLPSYSLLLNSMIDLTDERIITDKTQNLFFVNITDQDSMDTSFDFTMKLYQDGNLLKTKTNKVGSEGGLSLDLEDYGKYDLQFLVSDGIDLVSKDYKIVRSDGYFNDIQNYEGNVFKYSMSIDELEEIVNRYYSAYNYELKDQFDDFLNFDIGKDNFKKNEFFFDISGSSLKYKVNNGDKELLCTLDPSIMINQIYNDFTSKLNETSLEKVVERIVPQGYTIHHNNDSFVTQSVDGNQEEIFLTYKIDGVKNTVGLVFNADENQLSIIDNYDESSISQYAPIFTYDEDDYVIAPLLDLYRYLK